MVAKSMLLLVGVFKSVCNPLSLFLYFWSPKINIIYAESCQTKDLGSELELKFIH